MDINELDEILHPDDTESPSDFANRVGSYYASAASQGHKKDNGQFFTPKEIAGFMSSLYSQEEKESIKILDPGCGLGILSISVIEFLVGKSLKLKSVELVLFEVDIEILPLTEKCLEFLRVWLAERNINITVFLCKNDFIVHNSALLNGTIPSNEAYDIVISNPPYFKISKDDERASIIKSVSHGQINIYSIFLLISVQLLNTSGQFIFITPRSFCSGNYYRAFRKAFFALADLKFIHVFGSRKSAFKKDNVLQENLIISGTRRTASLTAADKITVSVSSGIKDLDSCLTKEHLASDLINFNSHQKILHLPTSPVDEEIIKIFKKWNGSLNQYGFEVSTGRVVDFRSLESITTRSSNSTVPLIWLHNVDPMRVTWPLPNKYKGKSKGQYFKNSEKSQSKLIDDKNYVFLRRFSTKDDRRRLIAAPHLSRQLGNFSKLAIENHLNYIYSKTKQLTIDQSFGLSALLNSNLFDLYFRTFNGNINVSATELRDMPLPNLKLIEKLGKRVRSMNNSIGVFDIDKLIIEIFNLEIHSCTWLSTIK